MTKIIVIFLTILFILFSFLFLNATHQNDHLKNQFKIGFYMADKNLFDAYFILKVKDKIGLNEKQENKIENIVLSFRESSIRKNAEIKIKELRLASYLKSEKIDRKYIERVVREISKMKETIKVNIFRFRLIEQYPFQGSCEG